MRNGHKACWNFNGRFRRKRTSWNSPSNIRSGQPHSYEDTIYDIITISEKCCCSQILRNPKTHNLSGSILIRITKIGGARRSSVGVAPRYRLDCPGIEFGWARDFLHLSRPSPGAHPAFCTMTLFPGGKAAGAWRWPPTPIYSWAQRKSRPIPLLPCGPSWLVLGWTSHFHWGTWVGTLIVATIYLQMIQNRYMFRSFTVLKCSHQHCVQPVASDMEVVGYL